MNDFVEKGMEESLLIIYPIVAAKTIIFSHWPGETNQRLQGKRMRIVNPCYYLIDKFHAQISIYNALALPDAFGLSSIGYKLAGKTKSGYNLGRV